MIPRIRWADLVVALVLVLGVATQAQAGTITLAWDPSPLEDVAGYVIFYGTTPGTHPYALGVGNQTSATVPGLAGGQLYYFIVQAYSSSDVLGPPSNEVSASTTNAAPQLSGPGTQSSTEGAPIALNIAPFATDADSDPLRYDATGLPPGLAIHPGTGLIGGTLSYFAAGTHTVTITVFDGFVEGTLTASASFTWTVANANGPPVVAPIPNQTSAENSGISLAVTVSDPDNDPLVFSAAGLPPGLTIDSATGLISGALSYTSAGTHLVTVIASDGGVLTGRQTFFWTVADVDRPPVVTEILDQTSGPFAAVFLKVTATDADGDSVTFSATGLPPGLTIDPVKGRITGTLSLASVGVYPAATVTALAGGLTAARTFTWTVTNQVTFPLKVSATGRYLVDQHNVPFLMTGDSPQAMFVDLDVSEATEYLTDRKARGFNTVWVNLICKTDNYGCRADGARYDGQKPFLSGAVDHENVLTPNETYFAQVDQIIAVATSLNLLVILDPMDTGGWTETLKNNSLPSLRAYGQYVGNRYKDVDNIFWLHGVDFQQWRIEAVDAKAREVALGIKDVDPRHLHTVQLDFKLSSSLDDPTWAPIIHVEGVYTYFPTYAEVLKAYNRASFLPVMMVEAAYEEETIFGGGDTGTPETLRRIEYWTVLSGATGQLFGNGTIWKMLAAWPSHLNTPGATQLGYLAALFGSRAWFNLVPDQTHTVLTSGYGTFSTTGNVIANDYATAAATPDGSLVMAYVPTARTVTVDMTRLGGPAVARWFDPTLGTFSTMITGAPLPNVGLRSFPTPGARADGSGDWVLVLEATPGIMLANPGNRTSSAGTVASLQLVATDPYGDPLTYSATNLPLGLTLHSSTGLIAGTLVHTALTTYPVTVTASDGTLSASQAFTWTVNENTQPPVLTHPGNQTSVGGTVALQLVATDPDGTGLTYSATGLPPGLTVNSATGLIAGTLTGTNAIYGVTVTASDGFLVSAPQIFTWTVVLSSPFVQANYATPQLDTTTVTVPFTAAQTAGNLNVVAVGWADTIRQVQSVVDTHGNEYELAVGPTQLAAGDGGPLSQSIYYAKNIGAPAAGANAVTVTFTGAARFADIRIAEYRGVDRVNPVDVTAVAQGSSGLSDSGPLTTTHANDLLVAANVTEGVTTAAGSGYTARVLTTPNAEILMDRVVTATGSYNATAPLYTPSGWVMQLVAFRGAAGTLNQPPTLSAVTNQTHAEGASISLAFTGGDPEGNPLTYSATGLPGGLSINATTGLISGTLTYTSAGVHTVTATVSDQSLTTTSPAFTWTVTNVNRAPVITALADRTSVENAAATLTASAADPDLDDVRTYSATGLPPGLTINATTGTVSGTLSYTSAGSHTVTVTVNDGRAAANSTASTQFVWTVTNTNRGPTLAAIPDRTSAENASVTLTVGATDPDSDDVLVYSAVGLPQGLTINATTGVISGTVSYTTSGLHGVTVKVTDGRGAANSTASVTFTWTVTDVNGPPVLTAMGHLTTTTAMSVSLQLAASDPDGDSVTYGATELPPGLSVNAGTGLITGTPSSAGVYPVTAIATSAGLSNNQSFVWTVVARPVGRVKFLQANSSTQQTAGTTVTVPLAGTQAVGHMNVVVVGWRDATAQVLAVTDSLGNLYQLAAGPTLAGGVGTQAIYYAANRAAAPAGGNAVTVAFTAPPNRPDIRLAAYAGIDSVNPVDVTASAQGAGATLNSGARPTTFADDVLIGASFVADSATVAPGAGFTTRLVSRAGNLLEERIVTTVGSYSATAALSPPGTWIMQMVAFRDPNQAPILTSPGPQLSTEHESIWVELSGTDPNDEPLTYSVTGLPASLTLNTSTGVISGILSSASAAFYPVTATVSDGTLQNSQTFLWTVTARDPRLTRATAGDFTGDGKGDVTVYRPSTGTWVILKSGLSAATWTYQWGQNGDLPLSGDYDGDGRADITVYRPSTGTWFIRKSSTNYLTWDVRQWGGNGDIPVPGDYDGDGKTDMAVYRPSTGTWFLLKSSTNATTWTVYRWGELGDRPVPGDYDGDGRADVAVFRPSDGNWFILKSSTNATAWSVHQWGGGGDVPVPGDFDGDGKADITVYRPSTGTWFILKSTTDATAWDVYQWGGNGDMPGAADYDGDGKVDVTVYRPSTGTWFVLKSSTNSTTWDLFQLGVSGDVPLFPRR